MEGQLNDFESQCQLVENQDRLEKCGDTLLQRSELRSFTARLRLFEERGLIVGFELLPERSLCYTLAVQFNGTFLIGEEHKQAFGFLERVRIDKRREGLSSAFFAEGVTLLPRYSPTWGYIEMLNEKSLGRTVQ